MKTFEEDVGMLESLVQLCDGGKDAIPRKYAKVANKCQKTWEEIQMKV